MAAERHAAGRPSTDGPVEVTNPSGEGDFVIVCEHAANFIPAELDDLGLSDDVLRSHIAWDPGALPVARAMSAELDAPLVAQRVSRLVYDCNRSQDSRSAVPAESEVYIVPGNVGLSAAARQARARRFYAPFREALAASIDRRMAARRPPVIVTVHSFAPIYKGVERDLDIGIIHDADARFADALLGIGETGTGFVIRRNAPYGPQNGVTHTLAEHAVPRRLLNVMFEIRNDLIGDSAGQLAMAEWLSSRAAEALAALADGADGSRRARSAV